LAYLQNTHLSLEMRPTELNDLKILLSRFLWRQISFLHMRRGNFRLD